jgi:hypothetical protein
MIGTVKNFVTVHALRILAGALAGVAIFAAIQTVRIEGVWCSDVEAGEKPACLVRGFKQEVTIIRIDLADAEARARAEAAKHKATKQAYREAQEEAARMQAEAIERVVARQEEITDEVRADYQQRIAALRARADRLRGETGTDRGSGSAGSPGDLRLPEDGDTAARIDEAPDCREIPAPDLSTDIRCREIAEEQAMQLDALITWVQRQFGVEP